MQTLKGFPDSSVGKESACNAGDPGWEDLLEKGQATHSSIWASLVANLVKNPPAMQETPVQFLSWEDPLEKGQATHSSIWASLVAQLVKNLSTMRETWVQLLGWEDPLEEAWQPIPYSSLENPHGQWRLASYSSPLSHKESDTTERLSTKHTHFVDVFLSKHLSQLLEFPMSTTCDY